MRTFKEELSGVFAENLRTGYKGANIDHERFPRNRRRNMVSESLRKMVTRVYLPTSRETHFKRRFEQFWTEWGEKFEYLFNLLDDEHSQMELVHISCYFILADYFRFPHHNDYRGFLKRAGTDCDQNDVLQFGERENERLYKYDYATGGYMYISKLSYIHNFLNHQYTYQFGSTSIRAEAGDVIIDGGAFVGDSALYFALASGLKGKVFAFEFVPKNIGMLRKNVRSSKCNSAIEIVEHPLWSKASEMMRYEDQSYASRISSDRETGHSNQVVTESIDHYFENIPKVDFIKLDVEGAEYEVLIGAKEIIKKHRPKLAVCLYHSREDFYRIPKLLNEMDLDYQFYLKHATVYHEETVLFAIPNNH